MKYKKGLMTVLEEISVRKVLSEHAKNKWYYKYNILVSGIIGMLKISINEYSYV